MGVHGAARARAIGAWSALLRDHAGSNAPLQAAWAAQVFTRAAEIIRYTDAGWSTLEVQRFADLLQRTYLPELTRVSIAHGAIRPTDVDHHMCWETLTHAGVGNGKR